MLRTTLRIPRNLRRLAPRIETDLSPEQLPGTEELRRFGEVCLLEDFVAVLHADGSTSELAHTVAMPYGEQELASWDETLNPFHKKECTYKCRTAHVIEPGGRVTKAKQSVVPFDPEQRGGATPYRVAVTRFAPLRPGVVVELELQRDWWVTDPLGPHLWRQYLLHTAGPCRRRRFTVAVAEKFVAEVLGHNDAPPAEERRQDGYRVWTWDLTDTPGVQLDGNEPHFRDFLPWVELSTLGSWQRVAEQHRVDLYPKLSRSDEKQQTREIAALAEQVFAGHDDDLSRLKSAYRYAAEDVRYGRPPSEVNERQPRGAPVMVGDLRGDCKDKSQLLRRLLDRVDIASSLLLVSTREEGVADALPPGRFNHAIVRCQLNGDTYLLDPAPGLYTFGETPSNVQGVAAMELNPSGPVELTRTAEAVPEQHGSRWVMEGDFGVDGALSVRAAGKAFGDRAATWRAGVRAQTDETPEEFFRRQLAAGRPGMEVHEVSFENHLDLDAPFIYRYEGRWNRAAERVRDVLPFSLMLNHPFLSDQLALKASRTCPVEGPTPARYTDHARIRLPEGYELAEMPPDVTDKTPWAAYALRFTLDGDTLVYKRKVLGLGGVVQPGAEYEEFCRHCKVVLDAAKTKVMLVPTSTSTSTAD